MNQDKKNIKAVKKLLKIKRQSKMKLNPSLLKRQGIDECGAKRILEIHADREDVFEEMEKESDHTKLRKLAKKVEKLEFLLQKAWGFEPNISMHAWWILIPHCSCPYSDNNELKGTGNRIYAPDCIIHGLSVKKNKA